MQRVTVMLSVFTLGAVAAQIKARADRKRGAAPNSKREFDWSDISEPGFEPRRSCCHLGASDRDPGGQCVLVAAGDLASGAPKGRATSPLHTPKECSSDSVKSAAPKHPFNVC